MGRTKVSLLLLGMILLVATSAAALDLQMKKPMKMYVKPVTVRIFPTLRVNCFYYIVWDGIPNAAYPTVWLQICSADRKNCGGGYPASNKGNYDFKPDISMAGKDFVAKVYTQDMKHVGYSNTFFVDGMQQQCCPDGRTLPPCQ